MVKLCPFCSEANIQFPSVAGGIAATCPNCGAYGPTSAIDGEDALALWNGGAPGSIDPNTPANATPP